MKIMDAFAVSHESHGDVRHDAVTTLVMNCLDVVSKPFSAEMPEYRKLLKVSEWDHANGCVVGSIPACSCGLRETKNFINLVRSANFVKRSLGVLSWNTDTDRWHPVILVHHPRPSERAEDEGIRYKSRFHHTEGFATREEAEVWIQKRPDTVLVENLLQGWGEADGLPLICQDFPRSLTI